MGQDLNSVTDGGTFGSKSSLQEFRLRAIVPGSGGELAPRLGRPQRASHPKPPDPAPTAGNPNCSDPTSGNVE